MSKKKKKKQREFREDENAAQAVSREAVSPENFEEDVSKGKVFLFWGVILLLILLAWVLETNIETREYVIEHWLIGGFAVFLVFFLFSLRKKK